MALALKTSHELTGRHYEVVVCGLGVSGLVFCSLFKSTSVLGLERRRLSEPEHKAALVRTRDLRLISNITQSVPTTILTQVSVWIDGQRKQFKLGGRSGSPYAAVDQHEVEKCLAQSIVLPTLLDGVHVEDIIGNGPPYTVHFRQEKQWNSVTCDRIVLASGSGSLAARVGIKYIEPFSDRMLQAATICVPEGAASPGELHHIQCTDRSFSLVPLSPDTFRVYFTYQFQRSDLVSAIAAFLKLPCEKIGVVHHSIYRSQDRRIVLFGGQAIHPIGDCSWTPDSVSGRGMSNAIRDGYALAAIANKGWPGFRLLIFRLRSILRPWHIGYLLSVLGMRFGSTPMQRAIRNTSISTLAAVLRLFHRANSNHRL